MRPQVIQGVTMNPGATKRMQPSRTSLSLSLSPESYELRKELAKVAVLSIVGGHVNEVSMLGVIPSIINAKLAGPVMPLNETFFLIPFSSQEEVQEVVKLGKFDVVTKDGPCRLNLAHWTVEIGAEGRAAGEGQWVHIWNLPLHGWCWNVIEQVLKPVGELITLSKVTVPHKRFLTVLVRRRLGMALPLELELPFGIRKYQVLITRKHSIMPKFSREGGRYFLSGVEEEGAGQQLGNRFTHEVSSNDKGKQKSGTSPSAAGVAEEETQGPGSDGLREHSGRLDRVQQRLGGVTILQRRPSAGDGEGSRAETLPPLVERSSHGADEDREPPVERSSREGNESSGPDQSVVADRTVGLRGRTSSQGRARSSERS